MDVNYDIMLVFFSINDIILQDVVDSEVLGSQRSVDYVWDDVTRPHELVVQIKGTCEILFFQGLHLCSYIFSLVILAWLLIATNAMK